MSDVTFVASDDAPSIYGTLAINGTPFDLTDAVEVRFQMRPAMSFRLSVDGVAAVLIPTAGTVRYDWADEDLSIAGEYTSRWRVEFTDGRIQHSEPENTITVDPV